MLKIYLCLMLISFGFVHAYAFEPIPITITNTMDKIIFDGKWTFQFEWKATSYNPYNYGNDTQVVLRSAHQGDFVYIFLDAVTDSRPNKSADYAVICFDTKNDKSESGDINDYCFVDTLDGKDGSTYQGGYQPGRTGSFEKITNPEGFVGIGGISDSNDRYTPIPHPSYEFKIPTSVIGRESVYGFYFSVYDGNLGKFYNYPQDSEPGEFVSSPSQWGEIYSPDKSLPEFELPLLLMTLSVLPIIFLSKLGRIGKFTR